MLTSRHKDIVADFESYQREVFEQLQPKGLYEPVRYLLNQPGKRLRPLLCLLTAEGIGGPKDKIFPLAAAIEVFHNFTLMHDDIMDEAPTRRGVPTVHYKYTTAQAILSGDVMLIWSYRLLMDLDMPEEQKLFINQRFSQVATEICEGQQMDMDFESRGDVTVGEYLRMIELKTAVLLGASMELGAIAAGFDHSKASELYDFGRLLGLSFQIQDDWLDAFGDPELTGKKPGGDVSRKKKTLIYLEAMEVMPAAVRTKLESLFHENKQMVDDDVDWVLQQFREYDIHKKVSSQVEMKMDEALEHLGRAAIPERLAEELRSFAEAIVFRSY